ncbi:hypothetical protein LTR36_010705 [Oleoguttula mirabilis]|uniref:Myotubularin phosphatase domain-containing protein n=1 Tax=Oleoguttula mirabilis TaxID=1507867 RepID=A0AAV9JRB3_9PEZI|nr:hypothetical protein LTR36_010705 [Oleoguttula mirabilis]
MAEKSKSRELRVRNVCLYGAYQRKRSKAGILGSLTVTRHHLTFTYSPEDQQDDTRSAQQTTMDSTNSSTLTQAATTDNEGRASGAAGDAKAQQKQPRQKSRMKTLWVPYPMINHCGLRPSHMQGAAARTQVHSDNSNWYEPDDSFPPTFGSSAYGRPSTDSAHLAPYSSPRRPASPVPDARNGMLHGDSGRSPAIRLRCRDFQVLAFHFNPNSPEDKTPDELARQLFFALRSRCCVERIEDMHAFHFQPPQEETKAEHRAYDARKEFARMGISGKAAEGPGSAWRITDINHDYSFSATYPSVLCVPQAVSDNMLKYGSVFRSRSRVPALSYLHFNGGSITRSSQPLVGVQGKRNPQDERLVSAIFASHTPPLMSPEGSPPQLPTLTSPSTTTLESISSDLATLEIEAPGRGSSQNQSDTPFDEKAAENDTPAPTKPKVYGSTRRNLIVDARPRINALANRATGGGIEDISNYMGAGEVPVEKVFLSIQNIHVMRSSLEKVVESFANSDYLALAPDQEVLRKSGWLGHIAGLLEGSELVARAVGLTGSHVLIHCSDGWDRTSQVSALAQIMLDPHYRTLNGFITLVQKDFLAFGHKFRDRNGIQGCEKWFEIENERITPSRQRDHTGSDSNSLNAIGSKALSGAKSWFEKNRTNLFRQQNADVDGTTDQPASRPASPPPNPIIHSPPPPNGKDEKEHKTSEKEISPIFHQFVEAVWQIQRQYPDEFEFNERFLLRLLYQTYAGQYGEFLFNCDKERWHYRNQAPSVWLHFMARRADFTNLEYTTEGRGSLLLPKRGADQRIDVRWWSKLFGREDEEMNLPSRPLAPVGPRSLSAQASSASFDEGPITGAEKVSTVSHGITFGEAESTPTKGQATPSFTSEFSALNMESGAGEDDEIAALTTRPPLSHQDTDVEVLLRYTGSSPPTSRTGDAGQAYTQAAPEQAEVQEDDDPLGVTSSMARKQETDRMDFAAFATQNAYQDR